MVLVIGELELVCGGAKSAHLKECCTILTRRQTGATLRDDGPRV